MSDNQDPLIGTLAAGRYRVIKPLGEGGMGQVYLAEHEAIEKPIALKVLHAEYAHKGDIVARFQQEAISASRIKHPNVLDVFDFGQLDNGCFYLAMEFLEGNDLAREIEKAKVLDPYRGLRIALQICRALAAAHGKGVVHRDMKPENVFLQRTGDGEEIVKIVDFGIAQLRSNEEAAAASTKRRLTRTGMIFGTPEYMSPEQAAGKKTDLRSDVYAVGIILYEMFTGAVPFTGDSFLGVLTKHVSDPPPPMHIVFSQLAIGPELQAVIMRALEKNPDHRFQSMNELAQAITATPEGSGMGRPSLVGMPMEVGGYASVSPGAPTAAQFHQQSTLGPVVQGGATGMQSGGYDAQSAGTAHTILANTGGVTQAGTASTVVPSKSNTGLVVALVGGALALAAAAGGFMMLKGRTTEPEAAARIEPPPAPPPPPVVAPPPTSAETTPTPSAAPAPSAVVSPATGFRLDVVTDPPGATLTKNGFQVCDQTPCEVTAAPNETLELEAKKGALKGTAKVLAQRDQRVSIKLAGAAKAPAGPRMCEVEVDGLKILRPCQ
ncbi:MAG TPA: serine/threonine-protein kinase [Polyangiaceae bacterium]|nr:serine/threonine-protein kinase [Polyangiaceae bacterium]